MYVIMSIQCGGVADSVVEKEPPNRKLSDRRVFFVCGWSWVFWGGGGRQIHSYICSKNRVRN